MSGLYLYAIVDHPEVPLRVSRGLDGGPLSMIAVQNAGAVVSALGGHAVRPGVDSLWRHDRVIQTLMEDRSVIPMPFGTRFDGEPELRAALYAGYRNLQEGLAHLRGKREMSLRVLRARDGRAGKHQNLELVVEDACPRETEDGSDEALASCIHGAFMRLSSEGSAELLVTPRMLLTSRYLVDQSRLPGFQAKLTLLSAVHPALRFVPSGPFPPYSFAPPELVEAFGSPSVRAVR